MPCARISTSDSVIVRTGGWAGAIAPIAEAAAIAADAVPSAIVKYDGGGGDAGRATLVAFRARWLIHFDSMLNNCLGAMQFGNLCLALERVRTDPDTANARRLVAQMHAMLVVLDRHIAQELLAYAPG